MTHPPFFARLGTALIVVASTCGNARGQDTLPIRTIAWNRDVEGQMRFLYAEMRTEFVGCLYGLHRNDTVFVSFFVPGTADPREATDSSVTLLRCPKFETTEGVRFIGVAHSHMRRGSTCFPSGYGKPAMTQDRGMLAEWAEKNGALFGAIMCASGDSISMYRVAGDYGIMAIAPLDSLYQRKP